MSSCETNDKLNVVILYDHITSVGRAMVAYLHLTRELESELSPELRIWRIDVAALQECAAQVDDDIKAAEMVIIAVRGSQPCPAGFHRWTEPAVEGGCMPRPALIAIVEAADEPARSEGTWSSVVRSTAAQTHRDIFVWASPKAADSPAGTGQSSASVPG